MHRDSQRGLFQRSQNLEVTLLCIHQEEGWTNCCLFTQWDMTHQEKGVTASRNNCIDFKNSVVFLFFFFFFCKRHRRVHFVGFHWCKAWKETKLTYGVEIRTVVTSRWRTEHKGGRGNVLGLRNCFISWLDRYISWLHRYIYILLKFVCLQIS